MKNRKISESEEIPATPSLEKEKSVDVVSKESSNEKGVLESIFSKDKNEEVK